MFCSKISMAKNFEKIAMKPTTNIAAQLIANKKLNELLFVGKTDIFDQDNKSVFGANKTVYKVKKTLFKNETPVTSNVNFAAKIKAIENEQHYYQPHEFIASFALPGAPNLDPKPINELAFNVRANFASGFEILH